MTYTETSYLGRVSRNRRSYVTKTDRTNYTDNSETKETHNPHVTATELETLYDGSIGNWEAHFKAILRCF